MSSTDPIIDLSIQHGAPRVKGDVTVIFTWLLHTGRPTMALVPTGSRMTHERAIPCLVPLDMAYLWDENVGDPTHCATMTFQFANALGLNAFQPRELIRLTSIIRDHLGDLLTMPSMPQGDRRVLADVIKTDHDTGKTEEAEILSDV